LFLAIETNMSKGIFAVLAILATISTSIHALQRSDENLPEGLLLIPDFKNGPPQENIGRIVGGEQALPGQFPYQV